MSAALVALIAAGILVYRLVVGVDDRRGFATTDLRWWIPWTAGILLLLIIVALRGEFARRRGTGAPAPENAALGRDDVLRELRGTAERIAATKSSTAVQQDWQSKLDRLGEREVSSVTVSQAKSMTAAAWLAWLGYDGEIEVRSVLPRR